MPKATGPSFDPCCDFDYVITVALRSVRRRGEDRDRINVNAPRYLGHGGRP